MQEVASSERNAAIRIPLFALEEIARIGKEHFLDPRCKDDRAHWALNDGMSRRSSLAVRGGAYLLPRVCPSPRAVLRTNR